MIDQTQVVKFLRKAKTKIITGISFVPALIVFGFFILAILVFESRNTAVEKFIVDLFPILSISDASTARAIYTTAAGGIISLTVFSFSMVMIVLNQAASNLSNRLLSGILSEKYHQITLGVYIGTIVYCFLMLYQVRTDESNASDLSTLGVFLCIIMVMADIFLFIYFLNYVTRSVNYGHVIQKIHSQTKDRLQNSLQDQIDRDEYQEEWVVSNLNNWYSVNSNESGYYQGIQKSTMSKIAAENEVKIYIPYNRGDYVVSGTQLFFLSIPPDKINKDVIDELFNCFDFYTDQIIHTHYQYGFTRLTEIAVKALSPGINDPATALSCIHSLADLHSVCLYKMDKPVIYTEEGEPVIFMEPLKFEHIFRSSFDPIINYGKTDFQILYNCMTTIEKLIFLDKKRHYYDSIFNEYIDHLLSTGEKHLENQYEVKRLTNLARSLRERIKSTRQ
ncbi:DUF2254 domain-containing protein [Marinigracilibium pacificum]|uniref:DUF2254 domain-containing protein n=1 Tax=Marinigracilibium pacificum TaxID=2729599 RepID=A0A848IW53_9BACT|nr:DUF2254 domain-containing protein [Marinigracilibium pacificum]NMM47471.1 DUF2254 domain-containing protein [Marinigracilibium pacificum]